MEKICDIGKIIHRTFQRPFNRWKCLLFFCALSRAKPLRTFAGNACSFSAHYPAQNRFSLLLEMLAAHYPTQNRSALLLEMLDEKK
ncbi:MAG: hypothetical protein ACTHLK_05770 [Brucella intermedia]